MDIQSDAQGALWLQDGPGYGELTDSLLERRPVNFPVYTGNTPLRILVTSLSKTNVVSFGAIEVTGILINHPNKPSVTFTYNINNLSHRNGSINLNPGEYEKLEN